MQPAEAIGILRGDEAAYYTPSMLEEAKKMGADALEFQGWLFSEGDNQWIRAEWVMRKWNGEDSFLDYALGEWRKENGNGNGR